MSQDVLSALFIELLPRLRQLQASLRQNQLTNNLTLAQLIQIASQIQEQQKKMQNMGPRYSMRYKDIAPDGYIWKKFGQKVEGRQCIKNYFKCVVDGCQAKRYVIVNKDSGEVQNRYMGEHTHDRNTILSAKAQTYEEYLAILGRIQQFVTPQGTLNGFGEQFDSHRITPDFPLKINTQTVSTVEQQPQDSKHYEAYITLAFQVEQEFNTIKSSMDPLVDPKQQLIYDGFAYVRYGQKKTERGDFIYMRCSVPGCQASKRIEISRTSARIVLEQRHSHHPSLIFNPDKFKACLGWIYRYDKEAQALINIANTRQRMEYSGFDTDDQGVINALTAYVNTDECQKTDNLMELYNLNQDKDDDEDSNMRYLFPHI